MRFPLRIPLPLGHDTLAENTSAHSDRFWSQFTTRKSRYAPASVTFQVIFFLWNRTLREIIIFWLIWLTGLMGWVQRFTIFVLSIVFGSQNWLTHFGSFLFFMTIFYCVWVCLTFPVRMSIFIVWTWIDNNRRIKCLYCFILYTFRSITRL